MQTIFLNYLFFLQFLYFERKFFGRSLKPFLRVCDHSIVRIYRNVLRKNKKWTLRKKINFFIILGDCEENFGVVVNTAFTEEMGSLCRSFFWIICFFLQFLYFERKFFGRSLKPFLRVCDHSIVRIYRNVLRKNKKWTLRKKNNFYTILGDCEENFGVVVNTAYTETTGTLCRPFFWIICFFYNFCTSSETFRNSLKTFRRVCNHSILRIYRNVLRKIKNDFCELKIIFISFSETASKTSAWWSTLHSPRQWDLYADHFFELYVFNVFVHWAKTFRPFVKNTSTRL